MPGVGFSGSSRAVRSVLGFTEKSKKKRIKNRSSRFATRSGVVAPPPGGVAPSVYPAQRPSPMRKKKVFFSEKTDETRKNGCRSDDARE